MKQFAIPVALFSVLQAWAQTTASPSPAEYTNLEITYRLTAGAALTERRSGEVRLLDSPLVDDFRNLVIPQRNTAGTVRVDRLELIHGGSAMAIGRSVEKSDGYFVWRVESAQPGDLIRFVVEQPVDMTAREAGGWWWSSATVLPLPVRQGKVTFVAPDGFRGSVAPNDKPEPSEKYAWPLDGSPATDHAARFTVSSFAEWPAFAAWFRNSCSAGTGARVRQIGSQIRSTKPDRVARLDAAVAMVQQRVAIRENTGASPVCRPVEKVLESGAGTRAEVQAVLASVLGALGFRADRLLTGSVTLAKGPPDPGGLTGNLLRVEAGNAVRWIDVFRLERGAGGLPLERSAEAALSVLRTGSTWSGPLAEEPGASIEPASLLVELRATFSSEGGLYASTNVRAAGSAVPWFNPTATQQPFASFLKNLSLRAEATREDGGQTISAEYIGNQENFFTPIEHRKRSPLNAMRLFREPVSLSDGSLVLGAPGIYKEVVRLEIPPARLASAPAHLEMNKDFARYESDSQVVNGTLLITRQLEIRSALAGPQAVAEAKAFWRTLQQDQEKAFSLTRLGPVDWDAIVAATAPWELLSTGWKAYSEQGEFEGARRFFQRAVDTDQRQAYYYLGLALVRLGRIEEAEKDFRKQIQADPAFQPPYGILSANYLRAGDYQRAIDLLMQQLAANPKNIAARTSLGNALLAAGRPAEAEKIAEALSLPAPLDRPVKLQLAAARICQGKAGPSDLDAVWGKNPAPAELDTVGRYLIACDANPSLSLALAAKDADALEPFIYSGTNDLRSAFAAQFQHSALLDLQGKLRLKKGEVAEAIAGFQAAVALSQNPAYMNDLAQALWVAGSKDEALEVWADAVATQIVPLSAIPEQPRAQLPDPRTFDRDWYEIGLGKANLVSDEEPRFYYLRAKDTGSVDRVRELSPEPSSPELLAAIRQLIFPQVRPQGKPIPCVYFVMMRLDSEGIPVFYRSNSNEMFFRMSELFPASFPVAPAVTAAQAARATALDAIRP